MCAFAAGALGPFTVAQLRERVGRVRARLDSCKSWAPRLSWRAVDQGLDHAARSIGRDLPGHAVMAGNVGATVTLSTYRSCAACAFRAQEMPQCSRCRSACRVQGGGGRGCGGRPLASLLYTL